MAAYPDVRLALPTGPMIVIVASLICLFSLMLAPERGLLLRVVRIARFRYQCICENLLKAMWRYGSDKEISFTDIAKRQSAPAWYLRFVLMRLSSQGWIVKSSTDAYHLTSEGSQWAARIVRLHRLWEVYLVDYLGVGSERVHRSAEEMEHIITPDLEKQLTMLLKDPQRDPHHQPIPPQG
jgi:manganese/zinc/iron transport system permease protein